MKLTINSTADNDPKNTGGAGASMPDPFLDALVNFEHEHGAMWDAWGSPSNLFASNSPPGARAFSGVVDDNRGGGGGGGNPSTSTTDRIDEDGGGRIPAFSTFPPSASSAVHRALPPLPSATAQQQPLPVQRTGSFDLPLVPPLLLGRHAGRGSVVRSDVNPHGGFIEREREPPILRAASAISEEWRQRQRMHRNTDESQGGGGRDRGRRDADFAGRGGSTHVANPHVGQWPTAGHGGGWREETIQSLLAAIPTVPPLAPPSLGSSRGGIAPRSYSELRPPPLVPSLQRSLSAPLGSLGGGGGPLGGGGGDGRAFATQPHGLGSSNSDGSIQGSGSLNSSLSEDPDRPFSFEASRGRERDPTVLGMSYGIGLNFPFADLDEAGRREYRRQRMLRWLEKRKRRTADRGITYSERSTLANRRERISGRFVKQTNAFISVTEFQRARAVGAGGSKGGGGGGSRMYAVEKQQQNDPGVHIAGAFRLPKDEEDEDDNFDDEEEDDDSKQGEDDDGDDTEDGDFKQRPRR